MSHFRILFLEDEDEDKKPVLAALASCRDKFDVVHKDTWDEAQDQLTNHPFDLVIADIWIFKNAAEKKKGERGAFPCLEPLLDITEAKYPPTPVIVYTGKESLNSIVEYQDKICDFWQKNREPLDGELLEFRVRKIKEQGGREHPVPYVISVIMSRLDEIERTGNSPIWADDIRSLASGYMQFVERADRIETAKTSLLSIAGRLNISESITSALESLMRIDVPSSSLLPGVRPHLEHSLNTFLLGYYLLNLTEIDWQTILQESDVHYKKDLSYALANGQDPADASNYAYECLNKAWFVASILHDIGIVVQYYNRMSNEMQELVNGLKIANNVRKVASLNLIRVEDLWRRAARAGGRDEVREFVTTNLPKTDHGIASALFIGSRCYDEALGVVKNEEVLGYLGTAAEAVAIHNGTTHSKCPKISISCEPIMFLLGLCDAIQAWDRDPIAVSLIREWQIARVFLTRLVAQPRRTGGPSVTADIRYLPHSLVATFRPGEQAAVSKLQAILQKHVSNPLKRTHRINGKVEHIPRFEINFYYGRKMLDRLTLPVEE